jgi:hypothetical protein
VKEHSEDEREMRGLLYVYQLGFGGRYRSGRTPRIGSNVHRDVTCGVGAPPDATPTRAPLLRKGLSKILTTDNASLRPRTAALATRKRREEPTGKQERGETDGMLIKYAHVHGVLTIINTIS